MINKEMLYKAGALVIGSLLWDNGSRAIWRKESFGCEIIPDSLKIKVNVPIRYGRYSSSRNSYTMVFSQDCYENQNLGTAFVVPFKKPNLSLKELIYESMKLSQAEGIGSSFIKGETKKWCILVNWTNPKMDEEKKITFLTKWNEQYNPQISKDIFNHFKMASDFDSIFDNNGSLKIPWPKELADYDMVIATQTQPIKENRDRKNYPSPEEIANKFFFKPGYFYNNRINGITTSQDEEINNFLYKKKGIF